MSFDFSVISDLSFPTLSFIWNDPAAREIGHACQASREWRDYGAGEGKVVLFVVGPLGARRGPSYFPPTERLDWVYHIKTFSDMDFGLSITDPFFQFPLRCPNLVSLEFGFFRWLGEDVFANYNGPEIALFAEWIGEIGAELKHLKVLEMDLAIVPEYGPDHGLSWDPDDARAIAQSFPELTSVRTFSLKLNEHHVY